MTDQDLQKPALEGFIKGTTENTEAVVSPSFGKRQNDCDGCADVGN